MSRDGADTSTRVRRHERCAAWLEGASDAELVALLADPRLLEVGHAAVQLPESDATVFVKLVPMTALELMPAHRGATANLFGLPVHYQYRLGSCGFGAWRELEVHGRVNDWVRSGQCAGFPLLHHWRMLPVVRTGYDDKRDLQPWGDCDAIHRRVAALDEATSSAVLLLEHFPLTLARWFPDEMRRAEDPVTIVRRIEGRLRELLAFAHEHGLLHLDAHFDNVLTDGHELYLGDYGLAMSRGFELGADEKRFFEEHQDFDLCTAINSLVHAVVTCYEPSENWRQTVRELAAGSLDAGRGVPAPLRSFVLERAPLVLAVGAFYERLLADLTTPYPAASFRALLETIAP